MQQTFDKNKLTLEKNKTINEHIFQLIFLYNWLK